MFQTIRKNSQFLPYFTIVSRLYVNPNFIFQLSVGPITFFLIIPTIVNMGPYDNAAVISKGLCFCLYQIVCTNAECLIVKNPP